MRYNHSSSDFIPSTILNLLEVLVRPVNRLEEPRFQHLMQQLIPGASRSRSWYVATLAVWVALLVFPPLCAPHGSLFVASPRSSSAAPSVGSSCLSRTLPWAPASSVVCGSAVWRRASVPAALWAVSAGSGPSSPPGLGAPGFSPRRARARVSPGCCRLPPARRFPRLARSPGVRSARGSCPSAPRPAALAPGGPAAAAGAWRALPSRPGRRRPPPPLRPPGFPRCPVARPAGLAAGPPAASSGLWPGRSRGFLSAPAAPLPVGPALAGSRPVPPPVLGSFRVPPPSAPPRRCPRALPPPRLLAPSLPSPPPAPPPPWILEIRNPHIPMRISDLNATSSSGRKCGPLR